MKKFLALLAFLLSPTSAFAQATLTPAPNGNTIGSIVAATNAALASYNQFGQGTAAPYVGAVATHTMTNFNDAAGSYQFMAKTYHYAKQSISSLSVVFPNFWVNPGVGEQSIGTGAVATIHASLEYPPGTFTEIKCGGVQNCSAPAGGMVATDYVTSPTPIPAGAKFTIWEWFNGTATGGGIPFTLLNGGAADAQETANGSYMQWGATEPDLTLTGGTLTQTAAGFYTFPEAIVALTVKPAVCVYGDSRAFGYRDPGSDASGAMGPLFRQLDRKYGTVNMAIPSDEAATINTGSWTNRFALAHYCSAAINQYGTNDFALLSATPATVITNRTTIEAGIPGVVWYGATLEPAPGSTDSYVTTANQTVATWESNRISFNASVRTGTAKEVAFIDLAHMIDPTDTGKWPVTGAAFGCTPEGLHENAISAALSNNATACGVFFNPFGNIEFTR
jgi:hypothetical protein